MQILPTKLLHDEQLGLAITQSALRAVQVDANGTIVSSTQVQLEPDTFSYHHIDETKFTQALTTLLSQAKFSTKYVSVCLPDYYSFTRQHTLPKIPLDEVTEALSWQIEQIFPIPKDQIYFDWKKIAETEKELKVMIVAMQSSTLDTLIEIFEKVDIKAIRFEPSISALSRLIVNKNQVNDFGLIEINQFGCSVALIEEGVSTLTVTHDFSQQQGQADTNHALEKTLQGVQTLKLFYQNHHNQEFTLPILLSGESASQEIASWLESSLQLSVQMVQIETIPTYFLTSFAAAQRANEKAKDGANLNLLPDSLHQLYTAQRRQQKIDSVMKYGLISAGLALVTSAIIFLTITIRLNILTTSLTQLTEVSQSYAYDKNLVTLANKTAVLVNQKFAAKTTPVVSIEQLYQAQLPGIQIHSVLYDATQKSFVVTGLALTRSDLLKFKDQLMSSESFSNVHIPLESLEKPTDILFSIRVAFAQPTPAQ